MIRNNIISEPFTTNIRTETRRKPEPALVYSIYGRDYKNMQNTNEEARRR